MGGYVWEADFPKGIFPIFKPLAATDLSGSLSAAQNALVGHDVASFKPLCDKSLYSREIVRTGSKNLSPFFASQTENFLPVTYGTNGGSGIFCQKRRY